MTVLILCVFETTYVLQFWEQMKKFYPEIRFSLLTHNDALAYYKDRLHPGRGERIYGYGGKRKISHIYLMKKLRVLPRFDIIHSFWMEGIWGYHAAQIRGKCDKWLSSVGGSDLYRFSNTKKQRWLIRRILNRASWLTSETENTEQYFFQVYGARYRSTPHSVNPFGIDILDKIEETDAGRIRDLRKKWGILEDKTVVTCGYSAGEVHAHIQMIQSIGKMGGEILKKCFFIFPMTYPQGKEDYISRVENHIRRVTGQYLILRDFLSTEEMAQMVMITDIMIHVQTTDQLSSTMLAHMYNGNAVIAGSWLPYDSLRKKGLGFISIDKISDLQACLPEIIRKIKVIKEQNQCNKEIIAGMSSWKTAAERWYKVYKKLSE